MSSLTALLEALPVCSRGCIANTALRSVCAAQGDAFASCLCDDSAFAIESTACVSTNCTVLDELRTRNVTSTSCGIAPNTNYSYEPFLLTFLGIALATFSLRILSRWLTGPRWWWDDLCALASMAVCIVFTALTIDAKKYGLGVDIWGVPFPHVSQMLIHGYVILLLYLFGSFWVRMAITLFYLRIFRDQSAEPILIGSFIVNAIVHLVYLFATAFECTPISYFWEQWDGLHGGHCANARSISWASALTTIVLDIWVILVPIPYIIRLNLDRSSRLWVCALFAFGVCVIIVSFVRLTVLDKFTLSSNPTLDWVPVAIFSGIELDVGVIVACLPAIPALYRHFHRRLLRVDRSPEAPIERFVWPKPSRAPTSSVMMHASTPSQNIQVTTTIRQDTGPSPRPPSKPDYASSAESQAYLAMQDIELGAPWPVQAQQHGRSAPHVQSRP